VKRTNGKRRLLFTGGGGAATEAWYRLLSRQFDVHFADADGDARPHPVPSRRWHVIPLASDAAFIDEMRRTCRSLNVDLLVPTVDEELIPIAAARERFDCAVLLPPVRFVERHLDKLASQQWLAEHGLPAADTEVLPGRGRVACPCVVKPRRGRGSRDFRIVQSDEEMRAHVLLSHRPPEDFIAQERLDGQEFTVTVAADRNGRLRAVVPVRVAVKRGITIRARTVRDEAVIAACAAIHAADPVAGCFNVQAVKTAGGAVKPFEINPRFSTTTCLAAAAGANQIEILFDVSQHSAEPGLVPFVEHLHLRRSWHSTFVRSFSHRKVRPG